MHLVRGFAFLLVSLMGAVSQAGYVIQSISNPIYDGRRPAIACSPAGRLVVAWAAEDFGIWTRAFPAIVPEFGDETEPIYHGPGHTPAICWSDGGFYLVYTSGSQIIVRQGNGDTWLPGSHVIETYGMLDWTRPDLASVPSASLDSVWLAFDVASASYSCDVWFVRRTSSGWEAPEVLATDIEYPASPRVTAASDVSEIGPRVYYLCNFSELHYRQHNGFAWSSPVPVSGGSFGMEMDATSALDSSQYLLSLGPQPPCPCNDIFFMRGFAGGSWSFPEILTVFYDFYDWPLYPAIEVTLNGVVHAFWYQVASDMELEETHWSLEYQTHEDGSWVDRSDIFAGHYGPHTDIALTVQGQPLFTWNNRPAGQNGEIMLARPDELVAVAQPTPRREFTLTAWPNPFNSALTITFAVPEVGPASLAVYDPRGRCVATLERETPASSSTQVVWNGCDQDGSSLPSGVYFLRLQTQSGGVTRKILLTK